jgi:hypothetical protein
MKNITPKIINNYKTKYSKQPERLLSNALRDIIKQIIETNKQNNFIKDEPKSKTSKFSYNNRPERSKLTHTNNEVINKIIAVSQVNSLTNR